MNEQTKSNPPGVAKALSAIGNTALAIGLIVFVLSVLVSSGNHEAGATGFALLVVIALFAAVPLGLSYIIRVIADAARGGR